MTRQTYLITVDVDDEVATIMTDVPGSLVRQIEHDSNLFDVVLLELVDTPKPKLRHRVVELEHSVDHLVSELHALQEWRKEHSAIDVGAIVDDRLGPLKRRFDALRDDLAESRRVGADIVETWANHRHAQTSAGVEIDPDGKTRVSRALTGKPEPTA
jgi:hypothetical protein